MEASDALLNASSHEYAFCDLPACFSPYMACLQVAAALLVVASSSALETGTARLAMRTALRRRETATAATRQSRRQDRTPLAHVPTETVA